MDKRNDSCIDCIYAKQIGSHLVLCKKLNVFVYDDYVPTQEFFVCKGEHYKRKEEQNG